MAHREEPERLSNALAQALGRVATRGSPAALELIWSTAAGGVSAQATRLLGYQAGVLRVEVDTVAWADALRGQVPQLEARLRDQLEGFLRLEIQLRGAH